MTAITPIQSAHDVLGVFSHKPKPTAPIKPGTGSGTQPAPATPSVPASAVTKPKVKPGQRLDKQGWPLNNQGQRVDTSGHAIDKNGRKINEHNQLINKQGHAVNEQGQRINRNNQPINDQGQRINSQGKPVDDKNRRVDSESRLIGPTGRTINEQGKFVDKNGERVNKEGLRVDARERPLDKDGKIARSKAEAVKGDNIPHPETDNKQALKGPKPWSSRPATPAPAPKLSAGDAAQRQADVDKLVKSGAIKPSPEDANIARQEAIKTMANGVVSIPTNAASTAATTWASEAIKARYLPVPLAAAKADDKASVTGTDTPKPDAKIEAANQALYVRMDDAQVSILSAADNALTMKYGDSDTKLVPSPSWPSDPVERMEALEKRLDHAEEHTQDLANTYKVFFKPYLPAKAAAEGLAGLAARIDTLEKRLAEVLEAQGKVKAEIERADASESE